MSLLHQVMLGSGPLPLDDCMLALDMRIPSLILARRFLYQQQLSELQVF